MRRGVLVIAIVGCGGEDGRGSTSFGSGVGSASTTIAATDGSSSEAGSGSSGNPGTTVGTDPGSTTDVVDPTTGPNATDPSATGTTDSGEVGCPALGGQDCSPGPGSGKGDTCVDGVSCYIDLVQAGVQAVIAAHPEWFDAVDPTLVLDAEAYMNAVVAEVGAQGVCAIRDPNAGDEMAVKHDNGFAESFDILTADGHARYGELIYTATCAPAWF